MPLALPVLLVHGVDDATVSIELARSYARRAAAAGAPVELVEVEGEAGAHRAHVDPRGAAWARVVQWLSTPAAAPGGPAGAAGAAGAVRMAGAEANGALDAQGAPDAQGASEAQGASGAPGRRDVIPRQR